MSTSPSSLPPVRFADLGVPSVLATALEQRGILSAFPIQAATLPDCLAGRDVCGKAPTGAGKTLAFGLAVLSRLATAPRAGRGRRDPTALVLVPTRELAAQIEEVIAPLGKVVGASVASIYGGVGYAKQLAALRRGVDVLIACPGRLTDLVERGAVRLSHVDMVVVDEADRMADMGFLPAVRRLLDLTASSRQTLLFSATLSSEIESLTREFLRSPKSVEIGRRSNPAETVTQFVYEVAPHLKTALLSHLLADPKLDTVLVFARTKHRADRLARQLERSGVKTATLHSNRSQNQRMRALRDFKAGAARVLVATDIAARGIDVDGISHVINFDLPQNPEDYVHRIGRTGRAQAIGDAISFVSPEDRGPLRSLERFLGRGIPRKRAEGFNHDVPAPEPSDTEETQARPARPLRPSRSPRSWSRAPRARRSPV